MNTAEELLYRAIRAGRAPHAVLLTGPYGLDSAPAARRAAALHCLQSLQVEKLVNCPDYQELGPGATGVDDIRAMQRALQPGAFHGNRAVVILEAHGMTEAAQNALLKTLEEPPAHTMLLLAGEESRLLYTIRSRCSTVRMQVPDVAATTRMLVASGASSQDARLAVSMSGGAPQLSERMLSEEFVKFFQLSQKLYLAAIQAWPSPPPYAALSVLMNTAPFPPASQARTKTEERRESGKCCLLIWQHLALEQLHASIHHADSTGFLPASLWGRFTSKAIESMINLILAAERRIAVANPQLTMDQLVTALCAPWNE